jgi:release factor glutamine methyltransferase
MSRHGDLPRIDRDVLLADALCRSRAWVIAHPEHPLTADTEARLDDAARRLKAGAPLAYLRGWKEFCGLRFEVSPAVLVPRPETELLVEACLARLETGDRVLDLGTGSGAIAVSLAHARPDLEVVAVDACPRALQQATGNAARIGADVEFLEGDWFSPFQDTSSPTFDIVVGNPPYVAQDHEALATLSAEPRMALVSGTDGLDDLRRIITHSPRHVRRWLLLEHGFDQAGTVQALMRQSGFSEVETLTDLAGLPRITCGRRQ